MKRTLLISVLFIAFMGCKNNDHSKTDKIVDTHEHDDHKESKKSVAAIKADLIKEGYQIFDYVDETTQDTIIMQQYYMAFLKKGPNRSQTEEELAKLQEAHLAHLGKMYEEGYADISGPFADDSDISGITVYNTPTLKMADSLANADPMVKAGRLVIEMHPWWAGKGFPLR